MSDEPREPWAFMATRGKKLGGVIAANVTSDMLKDFYSEFAGWDIITVYDRAEYDAKWKELDF